MGTHFYRSVNNAPLVILRLLIYCILIIDILIVSGCSSVQQVRNSDPIFSALTEKSPKAYTGCVAEKWQVRYPKMTSLPTTHGFQLTLMAHGLSDAVVAMLNANKYQGKTQV